MEIDIKQLVPRFMIRDKNCAPLCAACEAGMKYFAGIVESALACVLDPDEMPEWRLDEMAWELGLNWYDYKADIDRKRNVIRDARSFSAILGTPKAVTDILSALFGTVVLKEWNEYSGTPLHFNVTTTYDITIAENVARFNGMLNAVKSLRSTCDGIYFSGGDADAPAMALTAIVSQIYHETMTAE